MTVDVGQEAPDFTLPDQNKAPVTLSSFRGTHNVVLVFYPFAFSGVCTGELCALRDELPAFETAQTRILAVSIDSVFAHRVYADRERIDYPLLSDFWPHGAVAKAYGVFNDDIGAAMRGTFVIDRTGIVRWKVQNALPDARDVAEYEKVLAEL